MDPTTDVFICEHLSWREWATIRRIRLSWTKADLAEQAGVTRRWIWRGLECDPRDHRFVSVPQSVRDKIDAALTAEEERRANPDWSYEPVRVKVAS